MVIGSKRRLQRRERLSKEEVGGKGGVTVEEDAKYQMPMPARNANACDAKGSKGTSDGLVVQRGGRGPSQWMLRVLGTLHQGVVAR
jgi:hypothetical protein